MDDKAFGFSLIISFLVHVLSFTGLLYANTRYQRPKPLKNIEVVYHTQVREEVGAQRAVPLPLTERKWMLHPKILTRKDPGHASLVKDALRRPVLLKIHKKQTFRVSSLERKRHISVPLLKSEKITNPKYINYHERIRDKIRNRAYFYVNDPEFRDGEVYLTFVILSDGVLEKVKIIDRKTEANNYLRGVGLRSIKESSPFPAFPPDLKYPELSFNVVISFEVKE